MFHTGINAELLAEDVYQLDGRGTRASAKYQQLVSTMSTPATMAASIEARP